MSIGHKHALVYLASPYSDANPEVMAFRADAAAATMALMLDQGVNVFSPIACSASVSKFRKGEPFEYEAWSNVCEAMIERCDSLVVLMIDGWKASTGVQAEIVYARELGIPIRGIDIKGRSARID